MTTAVKDLRGVSDAIVAKLAEMAIKDNGNLQPIRSTPPSQ